MEFRFKSQYHLPEGPIFSLNVGILQFEKVYIIIVFFSSGNPSGCVGMDFLRHLDGNQHVDHTRRQNGLENTRLTVGQVVLLPLPW